jgi:FtsP/CotA-like multicopper oxidase with cupredoxin domain
MLNRRRFLASCGAAVATAALFDRERAWAAQRLPVDYTLEIAPIKLELAPGKVIHTVAYNGSVPGPLLRLPEGTPVAIDVVNGTDTPEFVHWHGLHIPAEVDGAADEGTPPVPPRGRRRYVFTPRPAGSRWYHSHTFAGRDLNQSTYSGQFGFLLVESRGDPGRYDQELFLAMHDWDSYITGGDDGFESVGYKYASINGRLLGFDDPIRVRAGERVLMHFLNASASEEHWLTLPGHRFTVIALDGNAVPRPASVDQLRLDPGERIDAIVEMNQPGIWTLGEPRDHMHHAGLGVVVEYAGRQGPAQWIASDSLQWNYLDFGQAPPPAPADPTPEPIRLVFKSVFHGHGAFEGWSINGKSFPHTDIRYLKEGGRYRLLFDNRSAEDHPVHLHRHTFELASVAGVRTAGILKDVVVVQAQTVVEVDLTAANPGKSLFHCHLQDHMDAGFMMLFDYR